MAFRANLISLEAIDVINPAGDRCTLHLLGFSGSNDATFIATQGLKLEFEFFPEDALKNGAKFVEKLRSRCSQKT